MERVYFYMTTHYGQNGLIVPPMALFLAKVRNLFFFSNVHVLNTEQDPLVDKYDLSSIKKWGCGAAPLGNDLNDAVEKRTKRSIRGGYGMTETTCVISFAARSSDKFGSVGKLLPGMTAKLIDGELWVKGPNIMKGYLRNDRANRETFTEDGWMKTGDVCIFDEDGDIYVVDRVKEVIIRLEFDVERFADVDLAHQIQRISGQFIALHLNSILIFAKLHRCHLQVSRQPTRTWACVLLNQTYRARGPTPQAS